MRAQLKAQVGIGFEQAICLLLQRDVKRLARQDICGVGPVEPHGRQVGSVHEDCDAGRWESVGLLSDRPGNGRPVWRDASDPERLGYNGLD